MSSFQLPPGDIYDGRCAEIFITEKRFLVYHCSVCEAIYATFQQLLSHLTNEHYENANEYKNEETLSVEIEIVSDDEQLVEEEEEVVVEAKEFDNTLDTKSFDQFNDDKYSEETNSSDDVWDVEVDCKEIEATNNEENIIDFKNVSFDSTETETSEMLQPKPNEHIQANMPLAESKRVLHFPGNRYYVPKIPATTNTTIKDCQQGNTTATRLLQPKPRDHIQNDALFAGTTRVLQTKPNTLDTSKTLAERKKMMIVTGMLKSNIISRTKLKPLTRYEPNAILTNNNGERKYVCVICGFAFKQRSNLRSHLQRHANKKDHTCSFCPRKFFTRSELRIHEHRHKDLRPYLCSHCGMGFVSSSSLTQHVKKRHSLERPFKCDQCEKAYTDAYQLKEHMVTHSDERLFACTECKASFKLKKFLTNHMNMHKNKRKFRCEYCDLGFGLESALQKHQRTKHDHEDYELVLEQDIDNEGSEEEEFLDEKLVLEKEEYELFDNEFD